MRKFVLVSRYCETDWEGKSSRSGGWSPRRLRGGQLLGTRAGTLHSGVLPRWPLGPEEESTAQEGGTCDQPEQEPGRWGCLVWLQANGFLVLSLAACPWRYCLHVRKTPPAASPVFLHVLCTYGWQVVTSWLFSSILIFFLLFLCLECPGLRSNLRSLLQLQLPANLIPRLPVYSFSFFKYYMPLRWSQAPFIGKPLPVYSCPQSLSISYSIRVAACIISFHTPVPLGSCSPFLHCTDGETETLWGLTLSQGRRSWSLCSCVYSAVAKSLSRVRHLQPHRL